MSHLDSAYDRAYYAGIAWERRAKARYQTGGPGAHRYVYEWIVTALRLFEKPSRSARRATTTRCSAGTRAFAS